MVNDPDHVTSTRIKPGEPVYDDDGVLVGHVSGFTEAGVEVETIDPDDLRGHSEEERPGQEFGEGYLMWRCGDCGEMGELDDGFPETCPNCGARKEDIGYWIED